MNDLDWVSVGKGTWRYSHQTPGSWRINEATIQVRGDGDWRLFINYKYLSTFTTWEEARDATPMMLKLHGYESQS